MRKQNLKHFSLPLLLCSKAFWYSSNKVWPCVKSQILLSDSDQSKAIQTNVKISKIIHLLFIKHTQKDRGAMYWLKSNKLLYYNGHVSATPHPPGTHCFSILEYSIHIMEIILFASWLVLTTNNLKFTVYWHLSVFSLGNIHVLWLLSFFLYKKYGICPWQHINHWNWLKMLSVFGWNGFFFCFPFHYQQQPMLIRNRPIQQQKTKQNRNTVLFEHDMKVWI